MIDDSPTDSPTNSPTFPYLPPEIKIGPYNYRIQISETAIAAASVVAQRGLIGSCDRRQTTLIIKPGLSPTMEVSTVLHEVIHAITDSTGLTETITHELEETIVNALAPTLLDTLRRNPQLVAYLLEGSSNE